MFGRGKTLQGASTAAVGGITLARIKGGSVGERGDAGTGVIARGISGEGLGPF